MNEKKTLRSRIRGWFPQEPNFSTQSNPTQIPKMHKAPPKRVIRFLKLMAIYFASLSSMFLFSTLQVVLIVLALTLGVLWFISNRRVYTGVTKVLRYCLIFILAFIVVFSGVQFYVFGTSGYPPTLATRDTYPHVVNTSLTQILQNVEQSENFRLLQFTHFGTLTFERLELHMYNSSWLMWTFHTRDTNSRITIGNSAGHPYYTGVDTLLSSLFPRQALPTRDFSLQTVRESFGQIDTLGLNWFKNYAINYYENHTGAKPEIAALNVDVGFSNTNGYEGLTILVSARSLSQDFRGTPVYPGIFEAEFQSNGNLLSLKNLN
jgi:hypothetical protein